MSDSREAYNGCLSLYSKEERILRGYISYSTIFHDNNTITRNIKTGYIGKRFKEYLYNQKIEYNSTSSSSLSSLNNKLIKTNDDDLDDLIEIGRNENDYYKAHYLFICDENSLSKIQVLEDPRTFDNLSKVFKFLPVDFVTFVWSTQDTWGACYDILSTFNSNDHHSFSFNFTYDPVSWPTLQSAYPRNYRNHKKNYNHKILITNNNNSNNDSHQNDYTNNNQNNNNNNNIEIHNMKVDEERMSENCDVISLSSSNLSGFSWCITKKENDDYEEIESIHSEASWELLSDDMNDFRKSDIERVSEIIDNIDMKNNLNICQSGEEESKTLDDENIRNEEENNQETIPFSMTILSIPSTKSYKDILLSEPMFSPHSYSHSSSSSSLDQQSKSSNVLKSPSIVRYEIVQIKPNIIRSSNWYDDDFIDYYGEDDTYVDWLETTQGSKETSAAAKNRMKLSHIKKSHEHKKKSKGTYSKKYVK